jgi:hypothetical protein
LANHNHHNPFTRQKDSSMQLKKSISFALGAALWSLPVASVLADVSLPPVSIGAGLRTSFTHSEISGTKIEADDFALNSARIYLSGKATDKIGFMFNTEYNGTAVDVIDAVAQVSFSDQFNVWAGRFLPPSDRANLYGPYYASHWGVYTDSIQDGYPFMTTGRDDGVAYWGQYGIAKVSIGAFDVPATKGKSDVLAAARVQLDFWDPEGGYYLNGTYYGDKDLLAVGVAAQNSHGKNAYSVDFLLEKKLPGAGVITVESEYAKYDGLGGYPSPAPVAYASSDGEYLLGAYLFPMEVGIGKFQLLAKYAKATFDFAATPDVDQKTMEFDFNYIIKQFNARISVFYIDTTFSPNAPGIMKDNKSYGVGLQIQM